MGGEVALLTGQRQGASFFLHYKVPDRSQTQVRHALWFTNKTDVDSLDDADLDMLLDEVAEQIVILFRTAVISLPPYQNLSQSFPSCGVCLPSYPSQAQCGNSLVLRKKLVFENTTGDVGEAFGASYSFTSG